MIFKKPVLWFWKYWHDKNRFKKIQESEFVFQFQLTLSHLFLLLSLPSAACQLMRIVHLLKGKFLFDSG